jgi:hypothetical protein
MPQPAPFLPPHTPLTATHNSGKTGLHSFALNPRHEDGVGNFEKNVYDEQVIAKSVFEDTKTTERKFEILKWEKHAEICQFDKQEQAERREVLYHEELMHDILQMKLNPAEKTWAEQKTQQLAKAADDETGWTTIDLLEEHDGTAA